MHWKPPSRRHRRRVSAIGTFVALSLFLHVLIIALLNPVWPDADRSPSDSVPIRLVVNVPEPEEPETPPEPPSPELNGQLVDTPRPEQEEDPQESDYLAEHDNRVEEETRTRQVRVNPEVLSPEYSEDDTLQFEDLMDLNVTEPSTGAQVGNDRFDPDRDGRLAALPSPYTLTNREGMQRPVPASTSTQSLAGAPNNDRLNERIGKAVNLNTRKLLGATYLNRIRRLVNFYWKQNLDNLPGSIRYARPSYTTVVVAVLDGNGAIESLEVTVESGSSPLDSAVVQAFKVAGPFPNPPSQLVAQDGRVYLPDMSWTVELGQAKAAYRGVDPRAGVQFPGILKAPR